MESDVLVALINLLESVGAPYIICLVLLYKNKKQTKEFVAAVNTMADSIDRLTTQIGVKETGGKYNEGSMERKGMEKDGEDCTGDSSEDSGLPDISVGHNGLTHLIRMDGIGGG